MRRVSGLVMLAAVATAGVGSAPAADNDGTALPSAPAGWQAGEINVRKSQVEASGRRYPRQVINRLDQGPGSARGAVSLGTFDCTRAAIIERAQTDPAVLEKTRESMRLYRYRQWPALARANERSAIDSIIVRVDRCTVVAIGGWGVTEATLRGYSTARRSMRSVVVAAGRNGRGRAAEAARANGGTGFAERPDGMTVRSTSHERRFQMNSNVRGRLRGVAVLLLVVASALLGGCATTESIS